MYRPSMGGGGGWGVRIKKWNGPNSYWVGGPLCKYDHFGEDLQK